MNPVRLLPTNGGNQHVKTDTSGRAATLGWQRLQPQAERHQNILATVPVGGRRAPFPAPSKGPLPTLDADVRVAARTEQTAAVTVGGTLLPHLRAASQHLSSTTLREVQTLKCQGRGVA